MLYFCELNRRKQIPKSSGTSLILFTKSIVSATDTVFTTYLLFFLKVLSSRIPKSTNMPYKYFIFNDIQPHIFQQSGQKWPKIDVTNVLFYYCTFCSRILNKILNKNTFSMYILLIWDDICLEIQQSYHVIDFSFQNQRFCYGGLCNIFS